MLQHERPGVRIEVAVTPSGSAARCFPWPKGSLYNTGTPSGSRCFSSTSSIDLVLGHSGLTFAPVALLHVAYYDSAHARELRLRGRAG